MRVLAPRGVLLDGRFEIAMSAAFDAVFAVFVLLLVGLGVVAVRWAVHKDRALREARAQAAEDGGEQKQSAT
ncbi:MAG: hypothetical protein ACRDV4_09065 [Acidimicrobiales bacterium]